METYAIGIDFGTLSGRCVLVNIRNGETVATEELIYPHAVMSESLPNGIRLGRHWALQHPQDYVDVLSQTIPAVLSHAGVPNKQVIGVGIDFTACTLIPIDRSGIPLCLIPAYTDRPHAYVKLWKHHAAEDQANRLNTIAKQRGEAFLDNYGGKISSEWAIPKILQILEEDRQIYDAAHAFVEATDWIIWKLTGRLTRNSTGAAIKTLWTSKDGYPDKSFFAALHPDLENLIEEKFTQPIVYKGERVGTITPEAARLTGLAEKTAVAAGELDGTSTVVGAGLSRPGQMLISLGTSGANMLLGFRDAVVPGVCKLAGDDFIPGFIVYESGQNAVGDMYDWFVRNFASYGNSSHESVSALAARQAPGESGLLALDWWNGNRTPFVSNSLSGLILGLTLASKPEDIYRSLIEATAFGLRRIIEEFTQQGENVTELFASGGIAHKNAFLLQTYADILGLPIRVVGSKHLPALSAAIVGAYSAGQEKSGFASLFDAMAAMSDKGGACYMPNQAFATVYDQLYAEHRTVYEYFGAKNGVMARLRNLARAANRDAGFTKS